MILINNYNDVKQTANLKQKKNAPVEEVLHNASPLSPSSAATMCCMCIYNMYISVYVSEYIFHVGSINQC